MWITSIFLLSALFQMYSAYSIEPDRVKSRCEKRRFESFREPSTTYTPRCNKDGSFAKVQCYHDSRKVKCWEVDEQGNQKGVTLHVTRDTLTFKPLTKCERMRKRRRDRSFGRLNSYIPACNIDGHFQQEQCNVGKTKCWCVGKKGKRIPGTKVRSPNRPNCSASIIGYGN